MIFKPHNYQKDCIDFLERKLCAGVFADPGLGKTAMVLHLLDRLYWRQEKLKVLIIAPLRVIHTVWPEEIAKWDLPFSYSILHGKDKEEKAKEDTDIHLLNVEYIFWLFKNPLKYDVLVIDESSKFKNPTSGRLKTLQEQLINFGRRIILTGTPSPNGLMDLWGQMFIIDWGRTLGRNITAFRDRFFYPTQYRNFMEWNPKSGADKAIQRHVAPLVRRIDAETHLDLPKLLSNTIKIQLLPHQRATYKSFEKKLFAELDNGETCILANAAAAYNICRQVANGRFYRPPEVLKLVDRTKKREVIKLHDHKIQALKELVDELQGKPLLIAYFFKHDLAQLVEHFGPDVAVIGGGTSAKESTEIIRKWNMGQIPILLGHPQSMSHGINLQYGGQDIAWFALTDNLEDYVQFIRRIYRQGVTKQTRVHHLLVDDTIDEAIMARLKSKDKNQRALLAALARYRETK